MTTHDEIDDRPLPGWVTRSYSPEMLAMPPTRDEMMMFLGIVVEAFRGLRARVAEIEKALDIIANSGPKA